MIRTIRDAEIAIQKLKRRRFASIGQLVNNQTIVNEVRETDAVNSVRDFRIVYTDESEVLVAGTDVALTDGLIDIEDNEEVTINIVTANVREPPTGADIIIDILRSSNLGASWASIFTSPKLTIAANDKIGEATNFNLSLIKNDLLRIDYTQIGSSVAGGGLRVVLRGRVG